MHEQSSEIGKTGIIILLSIIMLVGAGLRLYKVNYQSLWFDEIYTIKPTDPVNAVTSIIEYCKEDQPPAFFLYIHYFFKVFGYSDLNGRVASAIIGIVSIPVLYLLGKELQGTTTGLLAAMLTAVNFFHIRYSQEVRFYGMAFLFAALSYLFFIRTFKSSKSYSLVNLTGYTVSTIILLYTHYFGMIIYAIQALTFIVLITFYRRDMPFLIGGLIAGIIIPLAFIPWIPQIWSDLGIGTNWLQKPDLFFMREYFSNYFGKDKLVRVICLICFFLFFRSLMTKESSEKEKSLFLILTLWLILSYVIPYLRSIISTPVLEDRYTIVTVPVWMVIFAIGLNKLKNIRLRYSLAGIVLISSLVNLFFIQNYYTTIIKQQIREASLIVQAKNTSNEMMISNYEWHFNHYFRNFPRKVNNMFDDFSKVEKFWVLIIELTPQQKQEHLKLIDRNFEVAERYSFHKTEAMLMVRKRSLSENTQ